ncbi:MAG TPA: AI-2E family transporter [Burkholderiales bacterium]|nr:AI-2E family transporter [Burkholderiales bacterium]
MPTLGSAEDRQKWWWFAVGLAFLLLLYYLSPVLAPFLMAAVLAYICLPLVDKMSRRMPRPFAVVLVILLVATIFIVLLLVILPLFIREGITLAKSVPGWLDSLNRTVAPWVNARLGTDIQLDGESVTAAITDALQGNEDLAGKALATLRMGGLGLLGLVANLVLVPVVMFFLLRDWHSFIARFDQLIPRGWHLNVVGFFREANHALGQYLHGQVLVLMVMSLYYTLALWATGLDFFLPIGVVTGLLTFIPFVGATVGFVLATLSAFMQFDEITRIFWVWGVFLLGQAIEGNFITPRLVGNAIGLHPVAVIFALLAFGQLFGFTGMLIALPASAVLLVGLRKLRRRYLASPFYNRPAE